MMTLFHPKITARSQTGDGSDVVRFAPNDVLGGGELESEDVNTSNGNRTELQSALDAGPAWVAADKALARISARACLETGIDFKNTSPIQRLFITRYRCSKCGLLPLYRLIVSKARTRCGCCGELIRFRSAGKYGSLRKRIVTSMFNGSSSIQPLLGASLPNIDLRYCRIRGY